MIELRMDGQTIAGRLEERLVDAHVQGPVEAALKSGGKHLGHEDSREVITSGLATRSRWNVTGYSSRSVIATF
jgi:hypothetical protein